MKTPSRCWFVVTTADEIRALVREGAQLYNDEAYWEAHEAWEEAWLTLRGDGQEELADLLQGLILATAAFENLRRGKPDGFTIQGAKALHRLRQLGDRLDKLGVQAGDAFTEELTDAYLEVQRYKIDDLEALDRRIPELSVAE